MSSASFLRSSIGKKVVMALSGIVLFGFVVGHMLGNLQVYLGPTALNSYAEALRKVPVLLWSARISLLVAAALHVWAAVSLTAMNRRARPIGYREKRDRESTYASRTMRWTGVFLLAFVVYHLLHFTWGTVHPSFVPGDVYHNFVAGFRVTLVSAFYIAAMLALGLHLYHGVWSMLHTLGLSHPRYDRVRQSAAAAVTAVVVIANLSFPLAVMAGFVRERPRTAPPHAAARHQPANDDGSAMQSAITTDSPSAGPQRRATRDSFARSERGVRGARLQRPLAQRRREGGGARGVRRSTPLVD